MDLANQAIRISPPIRRSLGGPCPGNVFRDISGTPGRCRSDSWTVDFVNVSSVTAGVPNSDFNIWIYPVIGKTVCPDGTPTCANPVPLTLQYSAPNGNPSIQSADGSTSPGTSR